MSNLLDVTGDDIAKLDDSSLRELTGLLCEAEYRKNNISTKGITWGGNQDAPDGGLDVVVDSEEELPAASFVPRKNTGFQVKKPDMPKSAILKEMCPKGVLRDEIKTLIKNSGAYIIVCSGGSTTKTALDDRICAMQEAVKCENGHESFSLDFYDRGRIATWVRSYPSLVLWIRNKIGRALQGWQSYGNWSNSPEGLSEEYILDDTLRLIDGTVSKKSEGMSSAEGISRLRGALKRHHSSVRLVGLSGVGKTRLVQALFDNRIGSDALDPSQVIYTDMSHHPQPDPRTFAELLISDGYRIVLVVDNCPPDLHYRLTQTCSVNNSNISILTVEYDVRDDLPDQTSVFKLEPASEDVIKRVIQIRFPHIGDLDVNKIAEFSGGNARIAIALANTICQGETLSGFRDEDLFRRLFEQRNDNNDDLLISAEACALVYSFEGTDVVSESSELGILASIINKSKEELYRDVQELKRRDLVQSRDVWRALLPHAIANRLAKRALESIPKSKIRDIILKSQSERIIKSFSHRLSFLHDSREAVEIVDEWLDEKGWIGEEIDNLNPFGLDVFTYICPVSPEKALEAIERAANGGNSDKFTSRDNQYYGEFVRLLFHFAYDPDLFIRSTKIMCRFAISENPDENYNSTREVLKTLFFLYLSGTHATVEARAQIIEDLIADENIEYQQLGLLLLDSTLEAWHFSSVQEFGFGARPRDFGYEPKTFEEQGKWYKTFIEICVSIAISNREIAIKAREILSNNLRGLWTRGEMYGTIEVAVKKVHIHFPWHEGWKAVRSIIRFDKENIDQEITQKLLDLEKYLKPSSIIDKARAYAISQHNGYFDLEDDFDDDQDASAIRLNIDKQVENIGKQLVDNSDALKELIAEIISSSNSRIFCLGKGMAGGSSDKLELWRVLRNQFENTPSNEQNINVFSGFLKYCEENDLKSHQDILDQLLTDELLGQWFPVFQSNCVIDRRGITRIHAALDNNISDVNMYKFLAYGMAHEPISDDDLAALLQKISSKEGGVNVALEILVMRFHGSRKTPVIYSRKLIQTGSEILARYSFLNERKNGGMSGYNLARVAEKCLFESSASVTARIICENFVAAASNHTIYKPDYVELLQVIVKLQPKCFLDVFLGDTDVENYRYSCGYFDSSGKRENPINKISDKDLIHWCDIDPIVRYPIISIAIEAFAHSEGNAELAWKEIVFEIFNKAPSLDAVLTQFAESIRPRMWSGSRSDILKERSVLFKNLFQHENDEIGSWAKNEYTKLNKEILTNRKMEDGWNRESNESFE